MFKTHQVCKLPIICQKNLVINYWVWLSFINEKEVLTLVVVIVNDVNAIKRVLDFERDRDVTWDRIVAQGIKKFL